MADGGLRFSVCPPEEDAESAASRRQAPLVGIASAPGPLNLRALLCDLSMDGELTPTPANRLMSSRRMRRLTVEVSAGHDRDPLSPSEMASSPSGMSLLNELLGRDDKADVRLSASSDDLGSMSSSAGGAPELREHLGLCRGDIRKRTEAKETVADMCNNRLSLQTEDGRRLRDKSRAVMHQVASAAERPDPVVRRLEGACDASQSDFFSEPDEVTRGVVLAPACTPLDAFADSVVRPLVLFDWDDTLFPTEYIQKEIGFTGWAEGGASQTPPIAASSPHYSKLSAHAETLEQCLRAARQVACVAIVTLSMRPWVLNSGACFLPSINIAALLEELEIPVFYAREHVPTVVARHSATESGQGVCPFTVAKRCAIKHCLTTVYGKSTRNYHVISVGDSTTERDATWEVLWDLARGGTPRSRSYHACKTVKFASEPDLEQLGNQLRLLSSWLPQMLRYREDFDLNMEDSQDLEFQAWTVVFKDEVADVFSRLNPASDGTILRSELALVLRKLDDKAFSDKGLCHLLSVADVGSDRVRIDEFLNWIFDDRKDPFNVGYFCPG